MAKQGQNQGGERRFRGFTLVELMVAASIFSVVFATTMGIVAHMNKQAQLVPVYSRVRQTTDMTIRRISDAIRGSRGLIPSGDVPAVIAQLACSTSGRSASGTNRFKFNNCEDKTKVPTNAAVAIKEPFVKPGPATPVNSQTEEKDIFKQIAHQTSFAEVAWLDLYRRKAYNYKWNRSENMMKWRLQHNYKDQELQSGNVTSKVERLYNRYDLTHMLLNARLERRVVRFHNALRYRRFNAVVPLGGLGETPEIAFGMELQHGIQLLRYWRYVNAYRYIEQDSAYVYRENWKAAKGDLYYYRLGVKEHRINSFFKRRRVAMDFQARKFFLLQQRYMNWVVEDAYNYWTKEEHRYLQFVKQASLGETVLQERMYPVYAQSKQKRYHLQARQQLHKLQEHVRKYKLKKHTSKFSAFIKDRLNNEDFTLKDPFDPNVTINLTDLKNAGIIAVPGNDNDGNDMFVIFLADGTQYKGRISKIETNSGVTNIDTWKSAFDSPDLPSSIAGREVHFFSCTGGSSSCSENVDVTDSNQANGNATTTYGRFRTNNNDNNMLPPPAPAPTVFSHTNQAAQTALPGTVSSGSNSGSTQTYNVGQTLSGLNTTFPMLIRTPADSGTANYGTTNSMTVTGKTWETNRWKNHVVSLGGSGDAGLCVSDTNAKVSDSTDTATVASNIANTLTFGAVLANSRRICNYNPATPANATPTLTSPTLSAAVTTAAASQTFSFNTPNIPTGATINAVKVKVTYDDSSGAGKKFEVVSSDGNTVYASTTSPVASGSDWVVTNEINNQGNPVTAANGLKVRISTPDAGKNLIISVVDATFEWTATGTGSTTPASLTVTAQSRTFAFNSPNIPTGATITAVEVNVSHDGNSLSRKYEAISSDGNTVYDSTTTPPNSGTPWVVTSGINTQGDKVGSANQMQVKLTNNSVDTTWNVTTVSASFTYNYSTTKTATLSSNPLTMNDNLASEIVTVTSPNIPTGSTITKIEIGFTYALENGGSAEVRAVNSSDADYSTTCSLAQTNLVATAGTCTVTSDITGAGDPVAAANGMKIKFKNTRSSGALKNFNITAASIKFEYTTTTTRDTTSTLGTIVTSSTSQVFTFPAGPVPSGDTPAEVKVTVNYDHGSGTTRRFEVLDGSNADAVLVTDTAVGSGSPWTVTSSVNTRDKANNMKVRVSNRQVGTTLSVSSVSNSIKVSGVRATTATLNATVSTPIVSQTFVFGSPNIPVSATVTAARYTVTYTGGGGTRKYEAIGSDGTTVYATAGSPPSSGGIWQTTLENPAVNTVTEANDVRLKLSNLSSNTAWDVSNVVAYFEWTLPNVTNTAYSIPANRYHVKLTNSTSSSVQFAWDASTNKGLGAGDEYHIPRQVTFFTYVEDTTGGFPKWVDVASGSTTVAQLTGSALDTATVLVPNESGNNVNLDWTVWRDRGKGQPDEDYTGQPIASQNYRYRRTTGVIRTTNTIAGDIGHNGDDQADQSGFPSNGDDPGTTKVKVRWVEISDSIQSDSDRRASTWSNANSSDYKWNGDSTAAESSNFLGFGRQIDNPNSGGSNEFFQYVYMAANDSSVPFKPDGKDSNDNNVPNTFKYALDTQTRWVTIDADTATSVTTTAAITDSTPSYEPQKGNFNSFVGGQFVFVRDERNKIPQTSGNVDLTNFTALAGATLPDPPALPDGNGGFPEPWVLYADTSGNGLTGGSETANNNRYAFPKGSVINPNNTANGNYYGVPDTSANARSYILYDFNAHYSTANAGATNNNPDFANEFSGLTESQNSSLASTSFTNSYLRYWLTNGHFVDTSTGLIKASTGGTVTLAPTLTGAFLYPQLTGGGVPVCTATNVPPNCQNWTNKQNYMAWVNFQLRSDDPYYDASKPPSFYTKRGSTDYGATNPPNDGQACYGKVTIGGQGYDFVSRFDRDTNCILAFEPPVLADASDLSNTFDKTPTLGVFPYTADSYEGGQSTSQWVRYGNPIWSVPPNTVWPKYILAGAMPRATAATATNVRFSYAPNRKLNDTNSLTSPTGGWTIYSGCTDTGTAVSPCVGNGSNQAIDPLPRPSPDNDDNWQFNTNYSTGKADLFYTGALIKKQIDARAAGDTFRYSADNSNFKFKHPTTGEIYTAGANCSNDNGSVAGTKNVFKLTDPSAFCVNNNPDDPNSVRGLTGWQTLPFDPGNDVYNGRTNLTAIPSGYPSGVAVNFLSGQWANPIFPDKLSALTDYPEPDPAAGAHVPTGNGPPYTNGYIRAGTNAVVATANADAASSSIRFVVYGDTWVQSREPADGTNEGAGQPVFEYTYGGNMFFPISTEYPAGYSYEQLIDGANPDWVDCKSADSIGCKTPVKSDPHFVAYRLARNLPQQGSLNRYIKYDSFLSSGGIYQIPPPNAAKTSINVAGALNTKWFRYTPTPAAGGATNPYWDDSSLTLTSGGTQGPLNIGTTLYSKRPKKSLLKIVGDNTNTISTAASPIPNPITSIPASPAIYPYSAMPAADNLGEENTSSNDLRYSVNWLVRHKDLNRHYQYNAPTNLKVEYRDVSWEPIDLPFDPDNAAAGQTYTVITNPDNNASWTTTVPSGYSHQHKLINYYADRTNPNQIYSATNGNQLAAAAKFAYVSFGEWEDLKTAYAAVNASLPTPGPLTDEDVDPGFATGDAAYMIRIDIDHYWAQPASERGGGWGIAWAGKGSNTFYAFGGDIDKILSAWGDGGQIASQQGRLNAAGKIAPTRIDVGGGVMRDVMRYTDASGGIAEWRGYDNRMVSGKVGGGFYKNQNYDTTYGPMVGITGLGGDECRTAYSANVWIDPDHPTGYPSTAGPYPWDGAYTFPADSGTYPTANNAAVIVVPEDGVYNRSSQIVRIPNSGGVATPYTSWREAEYLRKPYSAITSPTYPTGERDSVIGSNAFSGVFHNDPDHDGWRPSGSSSYPRKPVPAAGDVHHRYDAIGNNYNRAIGIGVGIDDRFSSVYFCPTDPDGCSPYDPYNAADDNRVLDLDRYGDIVSGINNTSSLQNGIFVTWVKRAADNPAPAYHHYESSYQTVPGSSFCGNTTYGLCGEFNPFNPGNANNSDNKLDPHYVFVPYRSDGEPKSRTGTDQGRPVGEFYIGLEQHPIPAVRYPSYEGFYVYGAGYTGTGGFGWDVNHPKDHGQLYNNIRSKLGNKGYWDPSTKTLPIFDTAKDHPYGLGLAVPGGNPNAGELLPLDDIHIGMGAWPDSGTGATGWHNLWGRYRPKEFAGRQEMKLPPVRDGEGWPASTGNLGISHINNMNNYPGGFTNAGTVTQNIFRYGDQNKSNPANPFVELNTYVSTRDNAFIFRERAVRLLRRDIHNDWGQGGLPPDADAILQQNIPDDYLSADVSNVFFIKVDPPPDPVPVYRWNSIVTSTSDLYEIPADPRGNVPRNLPAGTDLNNQQAIAAACSSANGQGAQFTTSSRTLGGAALYLVPLNLTICYDNRPVTLGVRPSDTSGNPTTNVNQSDFWVDSNIGSDSSYWDTNWGSYVVAAEELPVFQPTPVTSFGNPSFGAVGGRGPNVPLENGFTMCSNRVSQLSPTYQGGGSGYFLPGTNPRSNPASTIVYNWNGSGNTNTGMSCGSTGSSNDPNAANWIDDLGASNPAQSGGVTKPPGGTYYLIHYAENDGEWRCVDGSCGYNFNLRTYDSSNGLPWNWNSSGTTLTKLAAPVLKIMRRNSVPFQPTIIYTRSPSEGGVVNDTNRIGSNYAYAACSGGGAMNEQPDGSYGSCGSGYYSNTEAWRTDVPTASSYLGVTAPKTSFRIVFGGPGWTGGGYAGSLYDFPANTYVPYDVSSFTNIPVSNMPVGSVWYTDDARMQSIGLSNANTTNQYRLIDKFWKVESTQGPKTVNDFKTFDQANPFDSSWQQVFVTNGPRNGWSGYWANLAFGSAPYWTGLNYQQYALLETTSGSGSFTAGAQNNYYEKWTPPFPGANVNSNQSGHYTHVDSGWTNTSSGNSQTRTVYDGGTINLPYYQYVARSGEYTKTVYSNNPDDSRYLARPERNCGSASGCGYIDGSGATYPAGTLGNIAYNRQLDGNKHIPHPPNIKWQLVMGASSPYEIWTLQHDNPNYVGDAGYHDGYRLPGTSGDPESWLPLDGTTPDPSKQAGMPAESSTIKTVLSGASDALFPGEWIKLTTIGPFGADVNNQAFKDKHRPRSNQWVTNSTGSTYANSGSYSAGNIWYRLLLDNGVNAVTKAGCEPASSDPLQNGCVHVNDDSIAAANNPGSMVNYQDYSWGSASPLGWVNVPPSFPFALGFGNFNYEAKRMLAPEDPVDGDSADPSGKIFIYASDNGVGYDNSRYYIETANQWPVKLRTAGTNGSRSTGTGIRDVNNAELVFSKAYRPDRYNASDLNNNALYRFYTTYTQTSDGDAFKRLPGHTTKNDPYVYTQLVTGADGNKKPKANWYFDYLRPKAPAGANTDYQPYSAPGEQSDRWVRTGILRIGTPDPLPNIFVSTLPSNGKDNSKFSGVPVDPNCIPPPGVYYDVCGALNWIKEGSERVPVINAQNSMRDLTAFARWRIIYWVKTGKDADTGMDTGDIYEVTIDNNSAGLPDDGTPLAVLLQTKPEYLNTARVRKLTAGEGGGGGRASVNIANFRIDQNAGGAHIDVTAFQMIDARRPAVYRTDTNVALRSLTP